MLGCQPLVAQPLHTYQLEITKHPLQIGCLYSALDKHPAQKRLRSDHARLAQLCPSISLIANSSEGRFKYYQHNVNNEIFQVANNPCKNFICSIVTVKLSNKKFYHQNFCKLWYVHDLTKWKISGKKLHLSLGIVVVLHNFAVFNVRGSSHGCFLHSRHLGDSEDCDSLHCMYMKEIISVHVHVHVISGQATSKPLYIQDMHLMSQQQ